MLILSKEDFYEVYLKSIITDYDRDTLTMLYQPIIGADAVALYLSLYSEFKKNKKSDSFTQHSELSLAMGFDTLEILEARRKLEGIGLLQTFYKSEKDIGFYKYLLYAPKTPKDFFDDILLKGLLITKIGEKNVQNLARKYKEKPLNLDGFNEISDSYRNVFNPNFDSEAFNGKDAKISGFDRKALDVSKGFDLSIFIKTLEEKYNIITKYVTKRDLKKISEIALLYGINEITFADIFSECYVNKTIDFDKIKTLCIKEKDFVDIRVNNYSQPIAYDTTSKLGKKIEMMSSISPVDYLKIKQKGSMVSPSDVKLVQDLYDDYKLNIGVINCLVDYCLEKTHQLNRNYVTKIAASLSREKIDNTLDAMNYLKNSNKKNSYSKSVKSHTNDEVKEEDISDEDLNDLLSGL